MWRATPAMATSGVLMAEAESGSCGSSPACNEAGQIACHEGGRIWREEIEAVGRSDLARGDRGRGKIPTVARCAVEPARGVEVDLEAHLRCAMDWEIHGRSTSEGDPLQHVKASRDPWEIHGRSMGDPWEIHIRGGSIAAREGVSRLTLCSRILS